MHFNDARRPVRMISFEDDASSDCPPNAEGILACLHLLAAEAAELGLAQTLDALQRAMGACTVEAMGTDENTALERPAGVRLN